MSPPPVLGPLLALAAAISAIASQGRTWPLVAAQVLLGGAWLTARRTPSGGTIPIAWIAAAGALVLFGTVSPPSAADESAYRFQARVFASGQLAAPAPAGNALVNNTHKTEFFINYNVQRDGKWFVQYLPGWPAALALPEKFGVGNYFNPVLALVALWIVSKTASFLAGPEAATFAPFLLIASPMFLLNYSGYYSHGMTSVLIAAAIWAAVTDSPESLRHPALAMAALAAAGMARPYTALVCGLPLALLLLWNRRDKPVAMASCAAITAAAAGAAAGLQAYYYYQMTGNPWRSLYTVYRGEESLGVLKVTPAALLANFRDLTIRSVLKSLAATIAFPALLAGAWTALRSRRAEYLAIAAIAAITPAAHTIVSEMSDTVVGERYYVEAFLGFAVLAAAGLKGPVPRWLLAGSLLTAAAAAFSLGAIQQARREPFTQVESLFKQRTGAEEVVFLGRTPDSNFEPLDVNLNRTDWQTARPLAIPDPGPDRRDGVVCSLKRKHWVVITPPGRGAPASVSAPVTPACVSSAPAPPGR